MSATPAPVKHVVQSDVAKKSTIIVNLTDTILCVDRRERSKKGIVFWIDTQFKMQSVEEDVLKQRLLKEFIPNQDQRELLSTIEIDVKTFAPYFCLVDDLGTMRFEKVKKRAMTNKIKSMVKLETHIQAQSTNDKDFIKYNKTTVELKETSARISMDDLYVINTVRAVL